jgi:hypothetical protein
MAVGATAEWLRQRSERNIELVDSFLSRFTGFTRVIIGDAIFVRCPLNG